MKPKAIEQISSFDGGIIKLYYSITAAAEDNNIEYGKMLDLLKTGQVHNRRRYKYYGEPIKFVQEWLPIRRYDCDGEEIGAYKNIIDAARETNYSRNYISNHIKYGTADKWGCTWVKLQKPN